MTQAKPNVWTSWARPLLLVAAVLAALLVVVGTGRAQEQGDGADDTFRVAIINLDQILAESEQWKDAAAQRDALAERADRVLKPLDKQRRAIERAVHDYPLGTEERREAQEAHREKELEYRRKRAEFDAQMREHFAGSYRSMLEAVNKACARYARDHGLQLVLKVGSPADLDQERDLLDVHTQQVVYAAPTLDISPQVVEILNAAYEAPIEDN